MAKPNYSFEKRQRELAKKKKKEEKLKEKAERKSSGNATGTGADHADDDAAADGELHRQDAAEGGATEQSVP